MTKRILLGNDDLIGQWVARRTGGSYHAGSGKTIALVEDDRIIAAVLYEGHNGASIQTHMAAVPGRNWMTRQYLWKIFDYPFRQLDCNLIIAPVASDNLDSRRFCKHLGFETQATLRDAHPNGDLLILGMYRNQCKWLKLGARYGQEQRA